MVSLAPTFSRSFPWNDYNWEYFGRSDALLLLFVFGSDLFVVFRFTRASGTVVVFVHSKTAAGIDTSSFSHCDRCYEKLRVRLVYTPMWTRSGPRLTVVVDLKPVSHWTKTASVPPTSPEHRLVGLWWMDEGLGTRDHVYSRSVRCFHSLDCLSSRISYSKTVQYESYTYYSITVRCDPII